MVYACDVPMKDDKETEEETEEGFALTEDEETDFEVWHDYVYAKESDVDPDKERDWFDLAYGFMLGRDHEPERALELACELMRKGWM